MFGVQRWLLSSRTEAHDSEFRARASYVRSCGSTTGCKWLLSLQHDQHFGDVGRSCQGEEEKKEVMMVGNDENLVAALMDDSDDGDHGSDGGQNDDPGPDSQNRETLNPAPSNPES